VIIFFSVFLVECGFVLEPRGNHLPFGAAVTSFLFSVILISAIVVLTWHIFVVIYLRGVF